MQRVLLYYQFCPISDPIAFAEVQRNFCRRESLLGRVYVAEEGINGTVGGRARDTDAYKAFLRKQPGMASIRFKEEETERVPFVRLNVKVKARLVNLGDYGGDTIVPVDDGGEHVNPNDFAAFLRGERGEYTLLDVRNQYEWDVGHFRGAQRAPFNAFFEFPKWVEQLDAPKDAPVLTYCTGGIRCEVFTGLLRRAGYTNVMQLKDGVLGYVAEQGADEWEGSCVVFDDRLVVDVGSPEPDICPCHHCGEPTRHLRNCANMDCHKLMVVCRACTLSHAGTCSEPCLSAKRLRPVDEASLGRPFRRKYVELPD